MAEQVRVGVVGTSWFADLMHLPALSSHPGARLAAICGRHRARAEEMAAKYGIPRVFTDYREMINDGDLQALIVITPDQMHYPITMAALDAGLHVLCEKPLALNARDARAMYEKAEAQGVKHMVMFTWRWMPHHWLMRQLVEEGYLGRPFDCDLQYFGSGGRSGQYKWTYDADYGLGALGALGSHMIDMARWCLGDIARVSAHLTNVVAKPRPDGQPYPPANDSALLLLQFVNGAHGVIHANQIAHEAERGQEQHVVLHGSDGTLEADLTLTVGGQLQGARRDEPQMRVLVAPTPVSQLMGDVFMRQSAGTRLFIEGILEDRPVSPNFYDGWKTQQIIDAALESDRTGGWVEVQ